MYPPQKAAPRKRWELSGGALFAMTGLLFPAMSVKPLAHAVGDYVNPTAPASAANVVNAG